MMRFFKAAIELVRLTVRFASRTRLGRRLERCWGAVQG